MTNFSHPIFIRKTSQKTTLMLFLYMHRVNLHEVSSDTGHKNFVAIHDFPISITFVLPNHEILQLCILNFVHVTYNHESLLLLVKLALFAPYLSLSPNLLLGYNNHLD